MVEPQAAQIYLLIAIGVVTMLVMAGAIILFVVFYQKRMIQEQMKRQVMEFEFQQKMLQAELQSQESERRRVAADLHDSIGGMLSTIRVGFFTISKLLPDPKQIDQTKQMLDDTISSVRRISQDLMPATLEKFGLTQALSELCDRFQGTSGTPVSFLDNGAYKGLETNKELMVYRIVQELLNNSIKHAQASKITVSFSTNHDLKVSVEDDGKGFNPDVSATEAKTVGLGLFNVQTRARILGGSIEIDRSRKKGSKTTLTVPFTDDKEA